ncbi:hypothetical protein EMIT047CA2_80089 [Pseudomonas soli]
MVSAMAQYQLKDASSFGDHEDSYADQADPDNGGEAQVSPLFLTLMNIVVNAVGMGGDPHHHASKQEEPEQHETVVTVVLDGLQPTGAFTPGWSLGSWESCSREPG